MSPTLPAPRRWIRRHPIPVALLVFAIVGLVIRVYALGYRVFYYDEAWFGYWILKFLDHGVWWYRPTLHGPFFVRVNSVVFPILGANDFTARLVVALMGGLLPLAAWLFRERLRSVETVALGGILALNPILLYYSRFMRKDFPLAAAMFVTLGLIVRFADTRRPRYLYAAGVSLAVAFSTKESVLLWGLMWLGAGLLIVDHRLVRAHARGGRPIAIVDRTISRIAKLDRRWIAHGLGTAVIFLAVVVYFYAPRSGTSGDPGLWTALGGDFGSLPTVIGESTIGAFTEALNHWVAGGKQDHPYLPYLADTVKTLVFGAPGVVLFATLGTLKDRYGTEDPRPLVGFSAFTGVLAALGFPIANNFPVPWSTIHTVVPLAIPAAVGVGVLVRWGFGALTNAHRTAGAGRRASRTGGSARAIVAALLLLAVLGVGLATAYQTSYRAPHESPWSDGGHEIVYYAQPPTELREHIDAINRAAGSGGDDVDVLYVGRQLVMDESAVEFPPETGAWHARMPLPWYTELADADVASVRGPLQLRQFGTPPPVVIVQPGQENAVRNILPDRYRMTRQPLDDRADRVLYFFVSE